MNRSLISRAGSVALTLFALGAAAAPLQAKDNKKPAAAPAPAGSSKVLHGVELRMVRKGGAETIEAYNANQGYDAVVKFEYQKMAMGAKTAETVSGREKLEAGNPKTIVNGGTKFHIQGIEIKDVELRTKL